jgi:hypothetical protein
VTTAESGYDVGAVGLFVDEMINMSALGGDTGSEPIDGFSLAQFAED